MAVPKPYPSQTYRDSLRWVCRQFMGPDHEAALLGERISDMHLPDLEALHELVCESHGPKVAQTCRRLAQEARDACHWRRPRLGLLRTLSDNIERDLTD